MRRTLLPIAAIAAIFATPSIAQAATNSAYHFAPCHTCSGINGVTPPYEAVKVRMRRSTTSWQSAAGGGLEIGLDANASQAGGTLVQMALDYAKDGNGCNGTTGGSVKLQEEAWIGGNLVACGPIQIVSGNEEHDLKIAKCGSHWCGYVDGSQVIDWGDLGITSGITSVEEYGNAASGAGAFAQVAFGGTSTPLAVSANGSSFVNVRQSDQAYVDGTNWSTDPFSPTTTYNLTYNS